MKYFLKAPRTHALHGFFYLVFPAIFLGGCLTLYDPPAVAKRLDTQTSYPQIQSNKVYFFLSKEAFPSDLQSVLVGTLFTPQDSQWTQKKIVEEFQKRASEIGGNAVVFESIETNKLLFGFLYYTGYASVYRLYKDNPLEEVDLSNTQYGTQNPDLQKVK